MTTGTKSLLIGVHQFAWHPLVVALAWVRLYHRLPTWREAICIVIHDWGYWGKPRMDDDQGETHPELGARIAERFLGYEYGDLCRYHSRHYARTWSHHPSMLCWPDKLSILYEPWWMYLPRAWASGELAEYRRTADRSGHVPLSATHREWYAWCQDRLAKIAQAQRGDVVSYQVKG
jgi:hypothetical protein